MLLLQEADPGPQPESSDQSPETDLLTEQRLSDSMHEDVDQPCLGPQHDDVCTLLQNCLKYISICIVMLLFFHLLLFFGSITV